MIVIIPVMISWQRTKSDIATFIAISTSNIHAFIPPRVAFWLIRNRAAACRHTEEMATVESICGNVYPNKCISEYKYCSENNLIKLLLLLHLVGQLPQLAVTLRKHERQRESMQQSEYGSQKL